VVTACGRPKDTGKSQLETPPTHHKNTFEKLNELQAALEVVKKVVDGTIETNPLTFTNSSFIG
jgi:hypothetical protein